MRYEKFLKSLGFVRKIAKKQQNISEPHNPGGVFNGLRAAPRSSNAIRNRAEHNMEAAPELGIALLEPEAADNEEEYTQTEEDSPAEGDDAWAEEDPPAEGDDAWAEEDSLAEGDDAWAEEDALAEEDDAWAEEDAPAEGEDYASAEEDIPAEEEESDETLDEEIARLLEADRILGNDLPDFDDVDFIKDVSVFDRERRSLHEAMMERQAIHALNRDEPEEETYPEIGQESNNRHYIRKPDKLVILSCIIGLCILLTFGVGFYMSQFPNMKYSSMNHNIIALKVPDNAINNASYIFINDEATALGLGFKLKKIAFGRLSSIFYFSHDAELENYSFELIDQSGKTYAEDMTMQRQADKVVFRPFTAGVAGFELNITDLRNNQAETLLFTLKDKKMMPARYINMPIDISPAGGGSILIDSAIFANTGTSLQIRLPNKDRHLIITPGTRVSMRDGAYMVLPKNLASGLYSMSDTRDLSGAYPVHTVFSESGLTLARVDFEPVRSLDDNITLSFKGISSLYDPHLTIETADLFDFAKKGEKVIPFEEFNLVIEGMQRQGNFIVLVMHGTDPETHDRIEIKPAIDLIAKDRQNMDVEIQGEGKSGPRGTDVLFRVGSNPGINMSPEFIRIKLNSIEAVLKDIDVLINLSELDTEPLAIREEMRAEIENTFENPAQMDLIYMEGNSLVGTILESQKPQSGPLLKHSISATYNGEQWEVESRYKVQVESSYKRQDTSYK